MSGKLLQVHVQEVVSAPSASTIRCQGSIPRCAATALTACHVSGCPPMNSKTPPTSAVKPPGFPGSAGNAAIAALQMSSGIRSDRGVVGMSGGPGAVELDLGRETQRAVRHADQVVNVGVSCLGRDGELVLIGVGLADDGALAVADRAQAGDLDGGLAARRLGGEDFGGVGEGLGGHFGSFLVSG